MLLHVQLEQFRLPFRVHLVLLEQEVIDLRVELQHLNEPALALAVHGMSPVTPIRPSVP